MLLLVLWYVHRATFSLILVGLIWLVKTGDLDHLVLEWSSLQEVLQHLASPLTWVVLALLLRFGSSLFARLSTYPLMVKQQQLHMSSPSFFAFRWLDRWRVMTGMQTLRWNHAVRVEAMSGFKSNFWSQGKLNTWFDIVNVLLLALLLIVMLIFY